MNFRKSVEEHPVLYLLGVIVTTASITWGALNQILVRPRDFEIERLRSAISKNEIVPQSSNSAQTGPTSVDRGTRNAFGPASALKAIEPSIVPTDGKNAAQLIQSLRKSRSLRPLSALESNMGIDEMPKGIYAFVQSTTLDYISQDIFFKVTTAVRYLRVEGLYFEIQNIETGIEIIGFISQESATHLSQLSGDKPIDFTMSTEAWGQFDTMISIPMNRIFKSRNRNIEISPKQSAYVLDITAY